MEGCIFSIIWDHSLHDPCDRADRKLALLDKHFKSRWTVIPITRIFKNP